MKIPVITGVSQINKRPGKSYLMNSRVIKTCVVLISLLLAVLPELKGGERGMRNSLSLNSARSYEERPSYRSYEDYIPKRRKSGKKRYKEYGKAREKKQKAVKRKKRTSGSRKYKRYHVKRGDTLYGISKKFRVPVKVIVKTNSLKSSKSIRTGMKLKIPINSGTHKRKISINRKRSKRPGAPVFKWPLKSVVKCHRDGKNGVKSIGILIKGRSNSRVVSSAGGVVKKIGKMRGYGTYVVIMHKNRYITVYSKLGRISVHEGKSLRRGDHIGYLDRNRTLHFQINQGGKSLNPLSYLGKKS
jgi:murein DD-endopeptidase MepM/ murein hydrolase activator NlpD